MPPPAALAAQQRPDQQAAQIDVLQQQIRDLQRAATLDAADLDAADLAGAAAEPSGPPARLSQPAEESIMAKLPGAVQGARIVGERFVRSQRQQNPKGGMPLLDHLRELRNRVVKIALGLIAGMIIGFIFFNPVWHVIEHPLCSAVIRGHTGCNTLGTNQLVLTGPLDAFYLRVKVAFVVGVDPVLAGLALPDLGLRRARPARPGEALELHLPGHRRPAVPDRRHAGLLVAGPVDALPARPDTEPRRRT